MPLSSRRPPRAARDPLDCQIASQPVVVQVMNMPTTCPLCGHPISRKQLERIEARVRREERARGREAEDRALQRLAHRHEEALENLRARLASRYEVDIAALQGRLRRRDLRDQRQIDAAVQRTTNQFAHERSVLRGKIQELE